MGRKGANASLTNVHAISALSAVQYYLFIPVDSRSVELYYNCFRKKLLRKRGAYIALLCKVAYLV